MQIVAPWCKHVFVFFWGGGYTIFFVFLGKLGKFLRAWGEASLYTAAIMFLGGLVIPKECTRWHNIHTSRQTVSENIVYNPSILNGIVLLI